MSNNTRYILTVVKAMLDTIREIKRQIDKVVAPVDRDEIALIFENAQNDIKEAAAELLKKGF